MTRHKFMLTAWHVFAICTLFFSGVFVSLMAYWTVSGSGVVVDFPNGIEIVEKEAKPGSEVTLKAGYCKYKSTSATTVTRSFQDELTFYTPAGTNNIPKGCNLDFKTKVRVPENLPPDVYTYNMTITYQVNPITNKQYTFESNKIKVIK